MLLCLAQPIKAPSKAARFFSSICIPLMPAAECGEREVDHVRHECIGTHSVRAGNEMQHVVVSTSDLVNDTRVGGD